uniref:Serine/threonine-protein kinase n=1 Tax=Solanum tuberosum TaxID=4113 RepID=M0ZXN5_SOLTU
MEADHPTIGEYTLTCKLGGGSSSTVWKAEHRTTGKVVALKQIDLLKLTRQLKNCLDCELNFLSSVEHPNIIRLFDVFQVSGVSLFNINKIIQLLYLGVRATCYLPLHKARTYRQQTPSVFCVLFFCQL